jgi:hypothetical protein
MTGYLKEFTGIPHLPPPIVPSVRGALPGKHKSLLSFPSVTVGLPL